MGSIRFLLFSVILLYLAMHWAGLLVSRKNNWRYLLFTTPVVALHATLLQINASQTFLYMYGGVVPKGKLSIGIQFVLKKSFESYPPEPEVYGVTKAVE
jgi:hypothetical protein